MTVGDVMDWKPYIVVDPEVLHGKPYFKETRIPVDVVLENIAAGMTVEEVIESYPSLDKNAIYAALAYAAEILRDWDDKI
jgi:uncharacterized protein (DUF433 family)